MRATVVKQLAVSFIISVVLLSIPTAICYYSLVQLFNSSRWVTHTHQVIDQLERLIVQIRDAETGVRGYLLTGQKRMLDPYYHASAASSQTYNNIKSLTSDNPSQQHTLPGLKMHLQKRLVLLDSLKYNKDANKVLLLGMITNGTLEMDRIRSVIGVMEQRERRLLVLRSKKEQLFMTFTSISVVVLGVIALAIIYWFFIRLRHSINKVLLLQNELRKKDASINDRLITVERFANKISEGDYDIRLEDHEKDLLGSVAGAINRMATSLGYAFSALQQQIRKKDEFISIASHELKTPLTSIKATMQMLGKHEFTNENDRKLHPFIVRANKQVKRLSGIVDNLLDVGRLSQESVQLNKTHFLLYEAVMECTAEIFSVVKTHELEINGVKTVEVFADKFRIEQVIVNLVSNAIKYSPNANKVEVNIETEEEMVKVSVRDFGIGIPEEHIPYLFERYYRAHESSQSFAGIGLGLYISYEFIKRHSGYMGVISEMGSGSTFWFALPVF